MACLHKEESSFSQRMIRLVMVQHPGRHGGPDVSGNGKAIAAWLCICHSVQGLTCIIQAVGALIVKLQT